jgi:hypothetical protein
MRGEVFVVDDPLEDAFKTEGRHRALGCIDERIVIRHAPGKPIELPLQRAAGGDRGIDAGALYPGIIAVGTAEIILRTRGRAIA